MTDLHGVVIKPAHAPDLQDFHTLHGIALGPGKSVVLSWNLEEWSNLSHWGYELVPGQYKIYAVPEVTGWYGLPSGVTTAATGHYFYSNGDGKRSAAVTLSVRP